MAVRLRLQRRGATKRPFYRVVAADRRAPRDGRFIELLGTYDPLQEPPMIRLKADRVNYWVGVGAIPSETVQGLIKRLEEGKAIDLSNAEAEKTALAARLENKKQAISDRRAAAIAQGKEADASATKAKADAEKVEEAPAEEAPAEAAAPEATEAPAEDAAPADTPDEPSEG